MALTYGKAAAYQVQLKGPYGSVSIRAVELRLLPDSWKGAVSPFAQTVELEGVTVTSKVDLQPQSSQLEALRQAGTALMAENNNGLVTVYAFGRKPEEEMAIQATVTEVQR